MKRTLKKRYDDASWSVTVSMYGQRETLYPAIIRGRYQYQFSNDKAKTPQWEDDPWKLLDIGEQGNVLVRLWNDETRQANGFNLKKSPLIVRINKERRAS
jgi:hypothetical protein